MVTAFDITLTRRTVFEPGALLQVGRLAVEFGQRALLVIGGASAQRSGALDRARVAVVEAGVDVEQFAGVERDPTVETADSAAAVARQGRFDSVIGLGGGSVMDCAKAVAMLAGNDGAAADYQLGERTVQRKGLPFIAVPTTSGTGSESNRVAVLTNRALSIKKAVAHPLMVPDVALLDPELALTLPRYETAYTGIDALSHAAEAYVSLNSTPITEAFALRALELVGRSLARACADGSGLAARSDMTLASALAGAALNAGVGCAHILAHPLGATFGVPHGVAIASVLPQVFAANAGASPERYTRIARALCPEREISAEEALRDLLRRIGFEPRLSAHGVSAEHFDTLYGGIEKSMRHVTTNPKPATYELLQSIFEASLRA